MNHALVAEQFLGYPWPDHDGSRNPLALHDLLGGERTDDDHRLPGVVPLPVAGGALDQRLVVGDARFLGRLRDAVDVAAERDHRRAGAPARHPGRGNPRDPLLDLEAVVAEDAGDVAGGLDLLEAEFAEAEDGVHHHLGQLGALGGPLVGDRAEGFEVLGGGGGYC